MGKLYDDDQRGQGAATRRSDAWIFDPTQPDGKPRPVLNTPEELAKLRAVMDARLGKFHDDADYGPARIPDRLARVLLQPIEIVEPALPPGETMRESEARALLAKAVVDAGGQRQLAEQFGQGHALVSKALSGKRRLGITVLAMIGLTPEQVTPDPVEELDA